MPDKNSIYRLSDELGVTAGDSSGGIILWDMRAYIPKRLQVLTCVEATELYAFIDDGKCKNCHDKIPDGDILCDDCMEEAQEARK